jgi:hypothetical protein
VPAERGPFPRDTYYHALRQGRSEAIRRTARCVARSQSSHCRGNRGSRWASRDASSQRHALVCALACSSHGLVHDRGLGSRQSPHVSTRSISSGSQPNVRTITTLQTREGVVNGRRCLRLS